MKRAAVVLAILAACHPRVRAPAPVEPLAQEGEVFLYLQPLPDDAERLSFSVGGVEAARADGAQTALEVSLSEVTAAAARGPRLVAWGRLPPGPYGGLLVRFTRATLATDEGLADLLASKEPVRLDVPFTVLPGRAVVIRMAVPPGQWRGQQFAFSGALSAAALRPEQTLVQVADYCSTTGSAVVFVIDRRVRQVAAAIPTGRQPQGMVLDVGARRAYVALAGEDQIQILDLATGDELRRIPLRTGDQPRELALTPDGRVLLTVNPGSNSVTFVDPAAGMVVDHVSVGDEPRSLLLDRGGRRAYVLSRRSNDVTVLDLANRAVVAKAPTDPEPLRAQLNRDGTRLYVIHRGSAWLNVFSIPDMAQVTRIFVGLGAAALKVDPRTDLVYVGRADEDRIQLFDPSSLLPVGEIEVPGPVSYLAIDDVENALVAVVPSRRQVAFVDLTRRRVLSTVDVGRDPYAIAPVSERF
jgi:YVTN family beta-propeller protein